jgi:hypothetical protein
MLQHGQSRSSCISATRGFSKRYPSLPRKFGLAKDLHFHGRQAFERRLGGEQPISESRHYWVVKIKDMTTRFWIGMLGVVIVVGILALLIGSPRVTAGAGAVPGPESGRPAQPSPIQTSAIPGQTYEGIITDAHCGAKHSATVGMGAAECTRVCVHSGEHFALVDGDKTYTLEGNDTALKRMAGQRVKVLGTLSGQTISVASVGTGAS